MARIYGMRHVNGDWFALDDNGHLRVLVFQSNCEAKQARATGSELLPFTPVALDEHSFEDIVSADGDCLISFWLVGNAAKLDRGYPLEFAQIALLVSDPRKSGEAPESIPQDPPLQVSDRTTHRPAGLLETETVEQHINWRVQDERTTRL